MVKFFLILTQRKTSLSCPYYNDLSDWIVLFLKRNVMLKQAWKVGRSDKTETL